MFSAIESLTKYVCSPLFIIDVEKPASKVKYKTIREKIKTKIILIEKCNFFIWHSTPSIGFTMLGKIPGFLDGDQNYCNLCGST